MSKRLRVSTCVCGLVVAFMCVAPGIYAGETETDTGKSTSTNTSIILNPSIQSEELQKTLISEAQEAKKKETKELFGSLEKHEKYFLNHRNRKYSNYRDWLKSVYQEMEKIDKRYPEKDRANPSYLYEQERQIRIAKNLDYIYKKSLWKENKAKARRQGNNQTAMKKPDKSFTIFNDTAKEQVVYFHYYHGMNYKEKAGVIQPGCTYDFIINGEKSFLWDHRLWVNGHEGRRYPVSAGQLIKVTDIFE